MHRDLTAKVGQGSVNAHLAVAGDHLAQGHQRVFCDVSADSAVIVTVNLPRMAEVCRMSASS